MEERFTLSPEEEILIEACLRLVSEAVLQDNEPVVKKFKEIVFNICNGKFPEENIRHVLDARILSLTIEKK